jgi:hypothetical protein
VSRIERLTLFRSPRFSGPFGEPTPAPSVWSRTSESNRTASRYKRDPLTRAARHGADDASRKRYGLLTKQILFHKRFIGKDSGVNRTPLTNGFADRVPAFGFRVMGGAVRVELTTVWLRARCFALQLRAHLAPDPRFERGSTASEAAALPAKLTGNILVSQTALYQFDAGPRNSV